MPVNKVNKQLLHAYTDDKNYANNILYHKNILLIKRTNYKNLYFCRLNLEKISTTLTFRKILRFNRYLVEFY